MSLQSGNSFTQLHPFKIVGERTKPYPSPVNSMFFFSSWEMYKKTAILPCKETNYRIMNHRSKQVPGDFCIFEFAIFFLFCHFVVALINTNTDYLKLTLSRQVQFVHCKFSQFQFKEHSRFNYSPLEFS